MLHEASPLPSGDLKAMLASYPFHPTVFVLPPWKAIYVTDSERDQSFAEAIDVHARVVQWYRACGYVLDEVPCLPVAQRARHVLRVLAESATA
jgi:predicted ATPase